MATIKDIARECGVSAMTVSAVINTKPGEVSASTRERILDAMRRLNTEVDHKRRDPAVVAREFLTSIGLLKAGR